MACRSGRKSFCHGAPASSWTVAHIRTDTDYIPPRLAVSCPWLRNDADVGLRRFPAVRIFPSRLVIAHRAGDDHILAALPVGRRRHLVRGGELQRIDHAQHLVEVAA